jgi:LAO/AO transport system kinase
VETVGVGQAETEAREMVDVFLLLAQPGAGDELQGMKRGIVELADVVCVTKADGDLLPRARETAAEYGAALRIAAGSGAAPEVFLVSAREGTGLAELWTALQERRRRMVADGELASRRERQQVAWMWRRVEDALLTSFREHPAVRATLAETESAVRTARTTPERAARRLLDAFGAPQRPE